MPCTHEPQVERLFFSFNTFKPTTNVDVWGTKINKHRQKYGFCRRQISAKAVTPQCAKAVLMTALGAHLGIQQKGKWPEITTFEIGNHPLARRVRPSLGPDFTRCQNIRQVTKGFGIRIADFLGRLYMGDRQFVAAKVVVALKSALDPPFH